MNCQSRDNSLRQIHTKKLNDITVLQVRIIRMEEPQENGHLLLHQKICHTTIQKLCHGDLDKQRLMVDRLILLKMVSSWELHILMAYLEQECLIEAVMIGCLGLSKI